jgi:hypothetical protein
VLVFGMNAVLKGRYRTALESKEGGKGRDGTGWDGTYEGEDIHVRVCMLWMVWCFDWR